MGEAFVASPKYRIKISNDAQKGLGRLPASKRKAVDRIIRDYLAVSPLQRVPGKTKQLKGAYKGILQYDIDDKHRIHYIVDNPKQIVRIRYIGPHPNW